MCYNNTRCRGIVQLVEHQSPKLGVAGSSPSAPVKKSKSQDLDFFICAARHNIICVAHATSFERQLNIVAAPRGTNERCCTLGANEVMLRINDVALRANGITAHSRREPLRIACEMVEMFT